MIRDGFRDGLRLLAFTTVLGVGFGLNCGSPAIEECTTGAEKFSDTRTFKSTIPRLGETRTELERVFGADGPPHMSVNAKTANDTMKISRMQNGKYEIRINTRLMSVAYNSICDDRKKFAERLIAGLSDFQPTLSPDPTDKIDDIIIIELDEGKLHVFYNEFSAFMSEAYFR